MVSVLSLSFLSGCATITRNNMDDPNPQESSDPESTIDRLQKRINELESRVLEPNQGQELTPSGLDQPPAQKGEIPTERVQAPVGTSQEVVMDPRPQTSDWQSKVPTDEAVETFRKAILYFQGRQLVQARTGFDEFLRKYNDHTLEESAQFYLAECDYQSHDLANAEKGFKKLLTHYPRGAHLTQGLLRLAEIADNRSNTKDALKHRQILLSIFPTSPAAQGVALVEHGELPENKPESNSGSNVDGVPPETAP